jgi:hypothetical protein
VLQDLDIRWRATTQVPGDCAAGRVIPAVKIADA